MPVLVKIFPKPKLWPSLVAGGSLTVGQEYFFAGFFLRGQPYYGQNTSAPSEEISIIPTTGNQSIKIEWWQDGGDITSFSDNGSGGTTVTCSTDHGRSDGDSIDIRGTSNYDGNYTISNVTATTFDISITFVATETGKWFADAGLPEYAGGINFRWDKYTMINASTGKYYTWNNMNDPANTGGEYDGTYGPQKWAAHLVTSGYGGTSATFTEESTSTDRDMYKLHDGSGASWRGYNYTIPGLCLRQGT